MLLQRACTRLSAPVRPGQPLTDVLAVAAVALVTYVVFRPQFLGYDLYFALDWGDDLAGGRVPDYGAPFAPTPHPLSVLTGALVSPLGFGAEPVIHALVLLGLGALCVGVYRLGAELYAWPVGLVAAVIVVTREPILFFATRPSIDVPFAAMVVWAAVLEARRLRRGAAVLVLLSVAGLLRPEGWAFAAGYWLWLAWPLSGPRRAALAVLAVSAPILWMLGDLAVTGDPLWSFNSVRDGGEATFGAPGEPVGGTISAGGMVLALQSIGSVADLLARYVGGIVRLPELIAAGAGVGAGLVWLRRRTLLPVAAATVNCATFAVLSFGEIVVANRFLFTAAAMFSLLAALAVFGWLSLQDDHPYRARWRMAGGVVLLGLILFAPFQAGRLEDLRDDIATQDSLRSELRDLVRLPSAENAIDRSCGPIYVPNHSFVPQIAYWMDIRPRDVVSLRTRRASSPGVLIAGASPGVEQRAFSARTERRRFTPRIPSPYRLVAGTRSWRLYTSCRAS